MMVMMMVKIMMAMMMMVIMMAVVMIVKMRIFIDTRQFGLQRSPQDPWAPAAPLHLPGSLDPQVPHVSDLASRTVLLIYCGKGRQTKIFFGLVKESCELL